MAFFLTDHRKLKFDIPFDCGRCSLTTGCESCFTIDWTNEYKYLGVIMESKLSFKKHIDLISSVGFKINKMFYLIREHCNTHILKLLYHSLYESRIQYGIAVWGNTHQTNLNQIIVNQKRIIRTIYNKHFLTSSRPLFRNLNVLPFLNLYIYRVMRLFFVQSGNTNGQTAQIYNLRTNRGKYFKMPYFRTECQRRSFHFSCLTIWNRLPPIINKNSLVLFMKSLYNYLIDVDSVEDLLVRNLQ